MISFCPQCGTAIVERPVGGKPRPACWQCGYVHFADPKVAATVLIEREGKLLLIRRNIDPGLGLWCLPGGFVDFGENPVEAAARECMEEVGLRVENLRLVDVQFNGR